MRSETFSLTFNSLSDYTAGLLAILSYSLREFSVKSRRYRQRTSNKANLCNWQLIEVLPCFKFIIIINI